MRKIFFLSLISLILITAYLFTGCSIFNRSNSSAPPEEQRQEEKVSEREITEPEQQMPAEKPRKDTLEYEVIEDLDTLPKKIAETLEDLKRQRGYFVFNPKDYGTGNDLYVLISAGEKPTGGYSISVESLILQNNTLKVVVKEQEPAAEDGVIQVITYPLVVIKMYDLIEGIYVTDEDNKEFKEITTQNLPSVSKSRGVYIGQVDNNFIEIEVSGEAKVFMLPDSKLIQKINDGDEIVIEYHKDEHGRLIVDSIY